MDIASTRPAIVDHDGRAYLLLDLIHYLPRAYAQQVDEMVPRSAQAYWDEVVRRWPSAADRVAVAIDKDWRL